MIRALNGYQCELCKSTYRETKDAADCESIPMEEPLLKIEDTIIDDQYNDTEIRVAKISYDGHEIKYSLEWQYGQDGKWEQMHSIYGNEMLLDYYELNSETGNFESKDINIL